MSKLLKLRSANVGSQSKLEFLCALKVVEIHEVIHINSSYTIFCIPTSLTLAKLGIFVGTLPMLFAMEQIRFKFSEADLNGQKAPFILDF